MTRSLLAACAALALALPLGAQEDAPSPNQIVAQAHPSEWIAIPAEDLLVIALAPDRDGNAREVVLQLMPAPFSQGWVANIRTLARAGWYDGITVNRVQDNYVVQWGDPNYDNPEATGASKALPEGLETEIPADYVVSANEPEFRNVRIRLLDTARERAEAETVNAKLDQGEQRLIELRRIVPPLVLVQQDPYAAAASFERGWPIGIDANELWPVHCYGMVGVGRGMSPDTGSGAELYTVIGHAPRHLDRNIALVGRVIAGMEHLSSLPRGSGDLGFYTAEEAGERTPIVSVRVASDLPEAETASSRQAVGPKTRPRFEYLSTEGETFARYAEARANRRDPFFIVPAGGADICNIPVPVRRAR